MDKFKLSLRISAISLLACLIYNSMCPIPAFRELVWRSFFLRELEGRIWTVLVLLGIILACASIYRHRNQMPIPDRHLRILTHVATWSTLAAVAASLFFHRICHIGGYMYFAMRSWQELLVGLPIVCWLWKMSTMTLNDDSLPQALSICVLMGALLSTIVLLMMLISAVHVFFFGHVIGFATYSYITWLRVLVPVVLLPCYTIHIKR